MTCRKCLWACSSIKLLVVTLLAFVAILFYSGFLRQVVSFAEVMFGTNDTMAVVKLGSFIIKVHGDPVRKSERIARTELARDLVTAGGERIPLPDFEARELLLNTNQECRVVPGSDSRQLRFLAECWIGSWNNPMNREDLETTNINDVAEFIKGYRKRHDKNTFM